MRIIIVREDPEDEANAYLAEQAAHYAIKEP